FPVLIKIQPPGIAPAFAKEFEPMAQWMIAPNTLLKLNPPDVRSDRAALAAVEPAVRPPGERIGHRVRILHPKSGKQHLRVGIGHIVAIAVRIKEQVRRLQNEDAAMTEGQSARQI